MGRKSVVVDAEALIRQSGARVTSARVRALALLLSQSDAVTHHEMEIALDRSGKIDRVTLYRTLDWLVAEQLAHKVLGEDRVWRFRVNKDQMGQRQHQHAHFKCERCEKLICLDDMSAAVKLPALPPGYQGKDIELTIRGICASCG